MTLGGERGAQLTARIEQRLVNGVAVGVQLDCQRVQRDPVQHYRHDDPALPLGQLLVHSVAQGVEQLMPLRLLGRPETEHPRQPVPILGVHRYARSLPEVPADLRGDLEHHELYAQVVNLLSPRKEASLPRIASIASAAAWWATSSSSTPLEPGDEFPALTLTTADGELALPETLAGDFGIVLPSPGARLGSMTLTDWHTGQSR